MGFFDRLVQGLTKTRNNIVSGIDAIFNGFSHIDEEFYEEYSNGERILKDPKNLFKQRCYIELGLNWFPHASGQKILEQLSKLGY